MDWADAPRRTGAVDGPLVVEAALAFATRVARGDAAPALVAVAGPMSAARGIMPAEETTHVADLSEREVEVLARLAD